MQENSFRVKKNNNGTKDVFLIGKYELKKEDEYYDTIEVIVSEINYKNNKTVFKNDLGIKFFSSIQFTLGKCNMDQQKCTICLCQFQKAVIQKQVHQDNDHDIYALPCSHIFHKICLKNMLGGRQWVKCPICATIFGKMIGDMPQGTMNVTVDPKMKCQGYPAGTIIINYSFGGCFRNGVRISGTSRTAYLPNTAQGKQVLELLKQAFDRRLTFTVGRSVTTGMDNQTVWNGIHHKTNISGGSASFGYPDPTYLKRVKQELAAKGIVSKKKHY